MGTEIEKQSESTNQIVMHGKELCEYIIKKILEGNVMFLSDEEMIGLLEKKNVKFEKIQKVNITRHNKESTLYFTPKTEYLKWYTQDVCEGAGANWETVFGFYFDSSSSGPVMIHTYFIGSRFDLDLLSEMIYTLFTDAKDCMKTSKISYIEKI